MTENTPAPGAFRLLMTGQTLSWLGDAFAPIALAVAVVGSGGSAGDLGLVLAATMVARLACTLFGGVWADRLAPQRVMIAADLVRAASTFGIAALFASGNHSIAALCALSAVTGGAGAFFQPAMISLRPLLVSVEDRHSANATVNLLGSSAQVLGPAAGGLFVAQAGPSWAFAFNAFTFLVSAFTVSLVRAEAERGPRAGMLSELGAGWGAVRSRDWLWVGILAAAVYHLAFGAAAVLTQFIAVRELGGATAVGWISAASGAGGVIGGLIALRSHPTRPLVAGFAALALMPLYVAAFVWPASLVSICSAAVLAFAGLMFFSVCWDTAMQDAVPHSLLARVSSWDILTSFVAIPAGNAMAGPLSEAVGTGPVLVVAAIVVGLAGIAPLAVRGSWTVRRAAAPEPEPALVS